MGDDARRTVAEAKNAAWNEFYPRAVEMLNGLVGAAREHRQAHAEHQAQNPELTHPLGCTGNDVAESVALLWHTDPGASRMLLVVAIGLLADSSHRTD